MTYRTRKEALDSLSEIGRKQYKAVKDQLFGGWVIIPR